MHTMKLPGGSARAVLACAAGGLLAAGCGQAGGQDAPDAAASTPHGHVEGATEAAEPQWRLVLADTGTGGLHLLDPATEKATKAGEVPGVQEAATDGRFAYLGTGESATVFDSGTWEVEHGDHSHYYRAKPGLVGEVETGGALHAAGDKAVTALSSDGGVQVLDRAALEEGTISQSELSGGGTALAYGKRLVAARPDGTVEVLGRGGEPAEQEIDQRCPDPQGQAVTQRGAVLGCSDGALLLTETGDGALEAETIPYPDQEGAEPVRSFHHRPGAAVLAGRTGDGAVQVLDTGAREWTRIDTGPTVAVSAAGEDMPVLALGEDGTLRAYDPASGEETAATEVMDPPAAEGDAAPAIRIDTTRAYVNDPAADAVHEIDYNDDLRLARTFDLAFSPDLMVETGW